jgi:molybdate-binding protein
MNFIKVIIIKTIVYLNFNKMILEKFNIIIYKKLTTCKILKNLIKNLEKRR